MRLLLSFLVFILCMAGAACVDDAGPADAGSDVGVEEAGVDAGADATQDTGGNQPTEAGADEGAVDAPSAYEGGSAG